MTAIDIDLPLKEIQRDFDHLEAHLRKGTARALDRMGLFVEARAVMTAASFTGRHRQSIHKEDVSYNPATQTYSVRVVADSAHSIYVELGFQGHFVPFHIADDLYRWAIQRAGWRPPAPGEVKNPQPGRRYLIPRGRKSPVWGMFIQGRAQPSLQPALDELDATGTRDAIIKEELLRAIQESRR